MRFAVLSSGSKANCTYLEVGETRLLIDCGMSAKETERRLADLAIDPASLNAILVTHEHYDHVRGLSVFTRRWKTPVFANEKTAERVHGVGGIQHFETGHPFELGCVKVSPVSITHDVVEPVGFVVEARGLKFAQFTDLGKSTPLVRASLMGANAVVLESNYDIELLRSCSYPWDLKARIASAHGHLSNEGAAELLEATIHRDLWHVVLGHLSENSNTPEHALSCTRKVFDAFVKAGGGDGPDVRCGSPYCSTGMIAVEPRIVEPRIVEPCIVEPCMVGSWSTIKSDSGIAQVANS